MEFTPKIVSYVEAVLILSEKYLGCSETMRDQFFKEAKERGFFYVEDGYYRVVDGGSDDSSKFSVQEGVQLSLV